jgi:hypothetical protein
MDLTATYDQFKVVKSAMSAQVTVIYSRDGNDLTLVRRAALLDPKMGGTSFSWGTDLDKPLVTTFLADLPGAVEVLDIT